MSQNYNRGYVNAYPENPRAGIWKPQDVFFKQRERSWAFINMPYNPLFYVNSFDPLSFSIANTWKDLSGNNNLEFINSSSTVIEPVLNNLQVIETANSGFKIMFSPALSIPQLSIFVVAIANNGGRVASVGTFGQDDTTATGAWSAISTVPTNILTRRQSQSSNTASAFTGYNLLYAETDLSGHRLRINGGDFIGNRSNANPNLTINQINIASRITANTDFLAGRIASVAVFPTVLSQFQRQVVEGILCWTCNLVFRLPENHPYKNTPPIY